MPQCGYIHIYSISSKCSENIYQSLDRWRYWAISSPLLLVIFTEQSNHLFYLFFGSEACDFLNKVVRCRPTRVRMCCFAHSCEFVSSSRRVFLVYAGIGTETNSYAFETDKRTNASKFGLMSVLCIRNAFVYVSCLFLASISHVLQVQNILQYITFASLQPRNRPESCRKFAQNSHVGNRKRPHLCIENSHTDSSEDYVIGEYLFHKIHEAQITQNSSHNKHTNKTTPADIQFRLPFWHISLPTLSRTLLRLRRILQYSRGKHHRNDTMYISIGISSDRIHSHENQTIEFHRHEHIFPPPGNNRIVGQRYPMATCAAFHIDVVHRRWTSLWP